MIVSGIHKELVKFLSWASFATRVLRRTHNPIRATLACRELATKLRSLRAGPSPSRFAKVDGRYFGHPHFPAWPSAAFDHLIDTELSLLAPEGDASKRNTALQLVFLAINRTCPLRCEHCFEWDALGDRESTSVADLVATVERFQDLGVSQVMLTGGEPMRRMDALLAILTHARPGTDFWVLSSGVGFTAKRARELKRAGLTGLVLSLDHWDPRAHDAFRGRNATFSWVLRAARAAKQVDLALVLSLCPTREFVTEDNLWRYATLARDLQADFIQIIEPRAVGHWANQDVALRPEQQELLERFIDQVHRNPAARHFPAVFSPDLTRRRSRCAGAGDRYVYVDTELQVHACPFCRGSVGGALEEDLAESICTLRSRGCGACEGACAQPQRTAPPLTFNTSPVM